MDGKTTRELEEILAHTESEAELDAYLEKEEIVPENTDFASCYLEMPEVRQADRADLIRKSGIERTYAYQILNGIRPHPSRDRIIALCLAAELDEAETSHCLKAGHCADLYPRRKRDAILLFALHHHMNALETDDLLYEYGEKALN
jgi:hypothetical protein